MPGVPLVQVNICKKDASDRKGFRKGYFFFSLLTLLSVLLLGHQMRIAKEPKAISFDNVSNIKSIHPDFTGRKRYFDEIEEIYERSEKRVPVAVLWGEGGVGKSETAIAFANRCLDRFPLVYWIESDLKEAYDQSYRNLANALQIPVQQKDPPDLVRKKVHEYLEKSRSPWLLVFDNAEKTLELPSKGRGNILITSRQQKLWHAFPCIHVLPFSEEEGLALIQRITHRREVKEQKKLLKRLNYFPLAVNQAAHYIAETPHISEKDYLQLLAESRLELLQQMPSDTRYPYGLVASWQITVDRLKKRHPEAVDWLYFSSYLYPNAISARWVETWLSLNKNASDPLQRELRASDILRTLIDFSLIRYDKRSEKISMHRLRQEVAQNFLKDIEPKVAQFLAKIVNAFEEIRNIEQHPEEWTTLSNWEANSLWFLETNAPYYRSPYTAEIESVLGNWNWMKGNFENAERFHRRALATRKALLDPHDPRIAASMSNLAHTVEFETAKNLHLSALEIRKRAFGEDHLKTAESLYSLATVFQAEGNYTRAIELHQEALQLRKKLCDEEHKDVVASLHQMSLCFHALGKTNTAHWYLMRTFHASSKLERHNHIQETNHLKDTLAVLHTSIHNTAIDILPSSFQFCPNPVNLLEEKNSRVCSLLAEENLWVRSSAQFCPR